MSIKAVRPLTIFVCALIVLSSCLPVLAESDSSEPDYAKIDSYVEREIKAAKIPGAALGVVKNDKTIYMKGYGKADETGRAVTPQTPFIIGSISKSFTALAVMQLVEAGKLELDAPVQKYLPWFRVADAEASAKMTARHLLTHTSGIDTYSGKDIYTGPGTDTIQELVHKQAGVKLSGPVGGGFLYSNVNYIILGAMVEAASGLSYEEYIKKHIFEPLEMKHSYVSREEAEKDGLAAGYMAWFGILRPAEFSYRSANLPAAYIISCAEDLSHYMIAMMNGGSYDGKSVITPESIKEMHRPAVKTSRNGSSYYGFGWYLGSDIFRHGGSLENYQSDLKVLTERGWGVIMLYNASGIKLSTLSSATRILPDGDVNICSGVISILYGMEPLYSGFINRGTVYLLIDLIFLAAYAVLIFTFVRFGHWKRSLKGKSRARKIRAVLAAAFQLGLSFVILLGAPKGAGINWADAMPSSPDLCYSLLGLAIGLFVLGAAKSVLILIHISSLLKKKSVEV